MIGWMMPNMQSRMNRGVSLTDWTHLRAGESEGRGEERKKKGRGGGGERKKGKEWEVLVVLLRVGIAGMQGSKGDMGQFKAGRIHKGQIIQALVTTGMLSNSGFLLSAMAKYWNTSIRKVRFLGLLFETSLWWQITKRSKVCLERLAGCHCSPPGDRGW